eukprot:4964919-Prymnesium_polylepis.1
MQIIDPVYAFQQYANYYGMELEMSAPAEALSSSEAKELSSRLTHFTWALVRVTHEYKLFDNYG